jgi:hypothetical protein
LHGEQYTEVLNPIPSTGVLVSTFKIVAVLDKGSGAVLVVDVVSKDKDTGLDILKNQVKLKTIDNQELIKITPTDKLIDVKSCLPCNKISRCFEM